MLQTEAHILIYLLITILICTIAIFTTMLYFLSRIEYILHTYLADFDDPDPPEMEPIPEDNAERHLKAIGDKDV